MHHLAYIEHKHKHHIILHLVHDQHEGGLPSHKHTPHTALLILFWETKIFQTSEYAPQIFVV